MYGIEFHKMIGMALASAVWVLSSQSAGAEEATSSKGPVVVELYTSQGCSSCPPADALLHQLTEYEDILPLALHVDYWDYIGWKDEFADPAHADRQRAYAHVGGRNMIYTPQMIIMGQDDVVGADGFALMGAIENHRNYQADVSMGLTSDASGQFTAALAGNSNATLELFVVRYSHSRSVDILRGELAGHSLSYANVVESLERVGSWSGRGTGEISFEYQNAAGQEAALLLQEAGHGPIVLARRLP